MWHKVARMMERHIYVAQTGVNVQNMWRKCMENSIKQEICYYFSLFNEKESLFSQFWLHFCENDEEIK